MHNCQGEIRAESALGAGFGRGPLSHRAKAFVFCSLGNGVALLGNKTRKLASDNTAITSVMPHLLGLAPQCGHVSSLASGLVESGEHRICDLRSGCKRARSTKVGWFQRSRITQATHLK